MDLLKREVDTIADDGAGDKGAMAATDLYQRASNARRYNQINFEDNWKILTDFYNDSMNGINTEDFEVKSKLLFQGMNKIVRNMKRPARKFLANGMTLEKLEVIKDAVDMVQADGGLYDCMTEDFNLFSRFTALGDCFVMLGYGDDNQPVKYTMPSLTSVYVDPTANCIRNKTDIGIAGEVLVIEEMSYDRAKKMYPKKKFYNGRLPMGNIWSKDYNKSEYQRLGGDERIVEIGHYYNIDAEKPYYCVIAGSGASIIETYEGKSYPFFSIENKAFIPLIHFRGLTSPTGFYNYGVWHLLYDFSKLQKELRNMAYKHMKSNINPVGIVNIEGVAEEFLEQWAIAREAQSLGERGFIINEIRGGVSNNSGQLTQLVQAPLTSEYERMLNDLTTEIKRCGIPIDDIDRPSSQKATTTLAEEGARLEFVQDIMERNIESFKEVDLLTIAMIASGVDFNNDKKVVTKVNYADGVPSQYTLGAIADALKNSNIDVDVESRTGAYKSEAFKMMASNELLQLSVGTPFEATVKAEALRLRGLSVSEEELAGGQQEQQQGGGQLPQNPEPSLSMAGQMKEMLGQSQPLI
jgi:hypothetical protein